MIYLIAAHEVGLCKIGCAVNVERRIATIATACPFDLELIATREGPVLVEKAIQRAAREYHVRREWFRFCPQVVEIFHSDALPNAPLLVMTCEGSAIAQKIDALGGTATAARILDLPLTTVHSWKRKGRIPYYRLPEVDAALAQHQGATA